MKTLLHIILILLIPGSVYSQQFYLRGEVRDEKGNILQNVNIRQVSSGYLYRTGNTGSFGITSIKQTDTLYFSFQGFQTEKVVANAENFINVRLKAVLSVSSNTRRNKLVSFTKDLSKDNQRKWYSGEETYASLVENNFIETKKYPTTGVALNIDRASYSNIRRFINLDMPVPPDAVRIEEMLNYFNFGYHPPEGNDLFNMKVRTAGCPWNKENQIFFFNVFSRKLNFDSLPPVNLVFLVDISGSMDMPNRLPLLKSGFHMLAHNLREKDTVSIIIYGGAVGVKLFPTGGAEKEKICKAIDELEPGGSTPGASGIRLAYDIAHKHFNKNGQNRIVLATDGDFNVGLQTEQELDELITRHRESGIYLTCLGVGMGNYKDSKIQTLARKGNGNFAYIDTYQEAEKVLMKEFTQTLYTVADDVYMNISFNPSVVNKYRLIGFDNKIGALADSLSVIEGGEIGSGQSVIAAFEIEPAHGAMNEILSKNIADINLQYLLPGDTVRKELNKQFLYDPVNFKELEPEYRFASSVIMLGLLLKESPFAKEISWGDILYHASESANPTDINQSQFVELVFKAKNYYSKQKKKKGKD